MVKSRELRGYWWLPGSDERVGGIAKYDPDEGVKLELFSPLVSEYSPEVVRFDRIFGQTTDSGLVTLNDCIQTRYSMKSVHSRETNPSEYTAKQVLIGDNLAGNVSFDRLRISFPRLLGWMGVSGIKTKPNNGKLSVVYDQPSRVQAETESKIIDFIVTWNQSRSPNEFTMSEDARLQITPLDGNIRLEDIGKEINTWKTFLTLATDEEEFPSEITAYISQDGQKKDIEIEIIGSTQTEQPVSETYNPYSANFSLKDIQPDLSDILYNWTKQHKKYGSSYGLYFSVVHESPMQLENQYLILATAIESFYQEKISESVDAAEGNHFSRALDSISSEYYETVEQLPWEISNARPKLVDRRNAIAHGSETKMTEASSLYDQVLLLQALLEVALLTELGIPPGQVSNSLSEKYSQRRPVE